MIFYSTLKTKKRNFYSFSLINIFIIDIFHPHTSHRRNMKNFFCFHSVDCCLLSWHLLFAFRLEDCKIPFSVLLCFFKRILRLFSQLYKCGCFVCMKCLTKEYYEKRWWNTSWGRRGLNSCVHKFFSVFL
jgi:hypothetical protein